MKATTNARDEKVLYAVLGIFLLGACVYVYEEVFATSTPTVATTTAVSAVPVSGAQATAGRDVKPVATTAADLDPTLHMEAMLVSEQVEYSGSGRNIFSANSAPVMAIQTPIAPARPKAPVAQAPAPPPVPTGPPPPPPIELKFFGYETLANGLRYAFLLHNEEVFRAAPGDILLRRYRVISVDAKNIQVEDMQFNNTQTLPLQAN